MKMHIFAVLLGCLPGKFVDKLIHVGLYKLSLMCSVSGVGNGRGVEGW